MPEIHFSRKLASAGDIIGEDPTTIAAFRQANNLRAHDRVLPGNAYTMHYASPQSQSIVRQINALPRQMQKDGRPRQSAWDGVGLRVLWYAYAIVLPVGAWNRPEDPFIDVPTVRRYATQLDRLLGLVFMVSGFLFVIVGLLGAVLLDLD